MHWSLDDLYEAHDVLDMFDELEGVRAQAEHDAASAASRRGRK
jgi:hypothetical protein